MSTSSLQKLAMTPSSAAAARLRHRHQLPRCNSASRRSARHRHSLRSRRSSSWFTFSSASMSFIANSSASTAARRANREGCTFAPATSSTDLRDGGRRYDVRPSRRLSVQGDECDHRHRDSFLAAGAGDLEWLPGRKQARLRRSGRSVQTAQLMMCRLASLEGFGEVFLSSARAARFRSHMIALSGPPAMPSGAVRLNPAIHVPRAERLKRPGDFLSLGLDGRSSLWRRLNPSLIARREPSSNKSHTMGRNGLPEASRSSGTNGRYP